MVYACVHLVDFLVNEYTFIYIDPIKFIANFAPHFARLQLRVFFW